jgi:hypothetical protein
VKRPLSDYVAAFGGALFMVGLVIGTVVLTTLAWQASPWIGLGITWFFLCGWSFVLWMILEERG